MLLTIHLPSPVDNIFYGSHKDVHNNCHTKEGVSESYKIKSCSDVWIPWAFVH